MLRVRFHAEEWVNDNAIEIDPKGPTEWDIDAAVLDRLLRTYRDPIDAFRYERWYADDDNCPAWIKEHDGPFWIEAIDNERSEA